MKTLSEQVNKLELDLKRLERELDWYTDYAEELELKAMLDEELGDELDMTIDERDMLSNENENFANFLDYIDYSQSEIDSIANGSFIKKEIK